MRRITPIALTLAAVAIAGCAAPMPTGQVTAREHGELVNTELQAVEVQHRTDGITLDLIARDGVRVTPVSPEEEANLLIPPDRLMRIVERLGDESLQPHRRIHYAW